MANEKTLEVILQLKDELSKKLSDTNLKVSNFGDNFNKAIKIAAGAFAANKLLSFTQDFIDSFSAQEAAMRKLQTALSNTGHSWESSSVQVNEFLDSVQKTTAFSNNEATEALQEMMVYTDDLTKATDGSRLAMNMAASGLFDLNSAVRYVGMAMEGNVEILGRYIPELRASSNENLASMSSAEKASYALGILQEKFGGMASGELETYAGQMKRLKNSFGDIKEGIGELVVKWLNLTQVAEFWSQKIDQILAKQNKMLSPGMAQLTTRLQGITEELNEWEGRARSSGIQKQIEQLQQERISIIQLMHQLQNAEALTRAGENYGAEITPSGFEDTETSFYKEQYSQRIEMNMDFLNEDSVLTQAGLSQEFESNLWLSEQLQELEYKDLAAKTLTAAQKGKIVQAAAEAERKAIAATYNYYAMAGMGMARIMTAAAQISGQSWLNAAGVMLKGISQVYATISKFKAIASPSPWDRAMAVIEIAAIAAETIAALIALENAKKQLSELTVGEFKGSFPEAAEGASIRRGGLIRVHDDETIVPARVSPLGSFEPIGNITIYISIAQAKLNSPSNIKDFTEELYRDIGFLTGREVGRPR